MAPEIISALNFVPITSVDVELSFSWYNMILTDKRQNFKVENLVEHIVVTCYEKNENGVIWLLETPIPGVQASLTKLRECGKRVQFISNNSGVKLELYQETLSNLTINSEDLIYPTLAIIDYLKSINFNKELFVIGLTPMKNEFKEAGFNLAELPDGLEEGPDIIKQLMQGNESIGAIIFDVDINLNLAKMNKAALCLKQADVLFLAGATDKKLLLEPDIFLIGPRYYQKIMEEFTGREPLVFGKPGLHLGKYISKTFNITDPSRTLFVGDSLELDMKFASLCGYQKMFVLTGLTTIDDMLRCEDNQMVPDYYLDSLGDLSRLIKDKLNI